MLNLVAANILRIKTCTLLVELIVEACLAAVVISRFLATKTNYGYVQGVIGLCAQYLRANKI